jgi:16S rRNA processing protein RimM
LTDKASDRFKAGRTLFVEGTDAPLTIVEAGQDSVGWRVRFAEVADRTAAETLRDVYLEIVVAPGEQLARGEYYWHQVIGATVSDLEGTVLGKVTDMYRAGGAEVMLVEGPSGEIDVPLVRPIVRIFAPDRGEIVVDADALGLDEAETEEEAGEDEGSTGDSPVDAELEVAETGVID